MMHEAKLPGVAAVYIVDHDEQSRLSLAKLFKHPDMETRLTSGPQFSDCREVGVTVAGNGIFCAQQQVWHTGLGKREIDIFHFCFRLDGDKVLFVGHHARKLQKCVLRIEKLPIGKIGYKFPQDRLPTLCCCAQCPNLCLGGFDYVTVIISSAVN